MGTSGHDRGVGVLGRDLAFRQQLQKLVVREVGQIFARRDPFFAEMHERLRGQARYLVQILGDVEFTPPGGQLLLALGEIGLGAGAQFLGNVLVEPLDGAEILDRHEGDLLDRRKSLGDQQMRDHVVDIESLDEHLRTGLELLGPALRFLCFRQDVDVPAGELRGEAHVLPAPANGEAQLIVGHHDLDAVGVLVQHHLGDFRRRQGVDDEGGVIRRPWDDVDLLALQLADHGLDAAAAHADACADGVDAGIVGQDGDLGPASGVSGDRLDLDDAVIDFRHFLGEQLGGELRPGARQENLRSPHFLAHIVNVGADAIALA